MDKKEQWRSAGRKKLSHRPNFHIGITVGEYISTVDGMGARAPPGDILLISVFRLEILSRKFLAMASS